MPTLYHQLHQQQNLLAAWETVRDKGSSGGIDGVSLEKFAADLEGNLAELAEELDNGRFIPLPYKELRIPKDDDEFRTLGLPAIRDKVVQQAVRDVLEPMLDRNFLDVSYAYRIGKGADKAIARVSHLINYEKREWLTKCDIDRYFDTIDHNLLLSRLSKVVRDEQLVTLIRLWLKMGRVDSRMHWTDSDKGIPQGSIISPLLSNFYLHPLDEFMVGKDYGYIRYADDFIILSHSEKEAQSAQRDVTWFVETRLHLHLNADGIIRSVVEGFRFLGITFKEAELQVDEKKLADIREKIATAVAKDGMASLENTVEAVQGIANYYGRLLPQSFLERIDADFLACLKEEARRAYESGRVKTKGEFQPLLAEVEFISDAFKITKNRKVKEILAFSARRTKATKAETGQPEQGGKDPVKKRKREYQKLEAEGFELVVSTPGAFIGKTKKGVVIKNKGVVVHEAPLNNLQHIFVTSSSVTLSSNVVAFCAEKKIPIDFMEHGGMPYARLYPLQAGNVPLQLAQLKAVEDIRGAHLAKTIVHGKIKNQINLAKYYHKYRKSFDAEFVAAFNAKIAIMDGLADEAKELSAEDNETLRGLLFSIEGRAANEYWQLATILLDGVIVFDGRERQGATDLVNSLLNYGYGILYSKIWNAVIRSGLSPYISYLHKPQSGKPTLIFDLIEEFRPQAVDRVVFSMINKGVEFTREDDMLSVECRNKLATGVLERINTIENFRGKDQRLIDVIKGQARAVGEYLLGESRRYAPYIGKW